MEPNDPNSFKAISSDQDDIIQDQPASEQITFTLTTDQSEIVHQVIRECIKDNGMLPDDYSSALHAVCLEYTRSHPLTGSAKLDDVQADNKAA